MALNIAEYLRNNFNQLLVKYQKYETRLNPQAHQLTSVTKIDRYPGIFNAVKDCYPLNQRGPKKILSFGCSTGEECATLRNYFPGCEIVGADINRKNLKKCREKFDDDYLSFIYSDPDLIRKESPYDIIFCLSVLCRWEETELVNNCEDIYPFSRFEQQLNLLDQVLSPGGLLVIYNSNFRFSDSKLYRNYRVMNSCFIEESGFVHKFDLKNNKIHEPYVECIFKKSAAKSSLTNT
ncbi:MAG: hypothetical protein DHS20C17_11060 [Cyclobacteriaceae bacterium]|nr:MAG: hypothetical protein DHS20C17_11060 [Cyclobacteriaceae bacterium]